MLRIKTGCTLTTKLDWKQFKMTIKGKLERRDKKLIKRLKESKIAKSRFTKKVKKIMGSKAMKVILPVVAILGAVAAGPALYGIVAAAQAAVLAETATVGSLTVSALLASYQAYNISKGVKAVKTLQDLNEEDQLRDGIEQILDVFERGDLPEGSFDPTKGPEATQKNPIPNSTDQNPHVGDKPPISNSQKPNDTTSTSNEIKISGSIWDNWMDDNSAIPWIGDGGCG